MSATTVHVIDDDADARDSLEFLLSAADVDVIAYESAAAFLAVAGEAEGCVVTDLRMPEIDGMELVRRLREMKVRLPIIVITGHGDVPLAVEAMKAGVRDFIEKPFNDETILRAIQGALAQGETPDAEADSGERAELRARIDSLSARERQVLSGLVAGKANKVIARDLDISPRTVEIYRANVMLKMQADSLSALVRMAMIAGVS
jgi:two-component system response regulator FixJ